MGQRPGHAAVQYGDLRGESAADFFQDVKRTDMQALARELGWEGEGRVVGMKLSIGERKYEETTLDCFYLTLQITDEYGVEELKEIIRESGGTLLVREHMLHNVDIVRVIKYFKRFEIGLFTKLVKPIEVEVTGSD